MLYTHLPYHNDSIIVKTDARWKIDAWINDAGTKDAWRETQEGFFNIFTSQFIARVRKGCSRFACERVLETEHKLHILTPLLWPSRCVFLVLVMLGSTPSGGSKRPLGRVWPFLPHLVSTVWNSAGNCIGGFPSAPSVGCGLPYHIWSLLSRILLATALGPKLNWVK